MNPETLLTKQAIVVGAGYSGAVLAERMASQLGFNVAILEQRDHIAGNCYDYKDDNGVIVHKYGPHLFHTNKLDVWQYLSQFTQWHPYEHEVLTRVDGQLVPLPFNLNTLHDLYPANEAAALEAKLLEKYGYNDKVPILRLLEQTDPDLQALAQMVWDKFFINYTTKQWGCKPEDISPAVTARVPVVLSRDNRYFQDKYQAIPVQGYTAMFKNMLDNDKIDLCLNQDFLTLADINLCSQEISIAGQKYNGIVVYTGMLDHLFNFCFGELPYRSLQFKLESHQTACFQPATTVNYPNEEQFTRITEFKHILPCDSTATTIVKEYPQDYDRKDKTKNIPYYPVFNNDNQSIYDRYKELAAKFSNLLTIGRLANYQYFNMDDAVNNALVAYETLAASKKVKELLGD